MRVLLAVACLAAVNPLLAADAQMDEMLALIREQQTQIAALQQRLDEQKRTLESLREQVEVTARSSEAANEKAEILAENIESRPQVAHSATTLGGYGELHVNQLDDQHGDNDKDQIDFHRFVLFLNHEFNDRMRFASELELEHSLSGDGKPGEVELEQAYFEYDWTEGHSLKAGLFLLPIGFLNETHEPPTFYGVERNPVESRIIPTTWWEGGVAFQGRFADAWSYDFAAHSGLETGAGSNYAVRSGRQKVAEAGFDSMAYTGRIRWRGLPGLELAASAQYQEDVTQESDPTAGGAWLYSGHLSWQRGPFALRALYARWDLDGAGPESVGADRQDGWFVEPSWRFTEQWGVFARYSVWDNQAGGAGDTEYAQTDVGVNFWPHPQVVFKLDYQDQDAPPGSSELDGWNLGFGYQF